MAMFDEIEVSVGHLENEVIQCHEICNQAEKNLAELWKVEREVEVKKALSKKYIAISGTYKRTEDDREVYVDSSDEWALVKIDPYDENDTRKTLDKFSYMIMSTDEKNRLVEKYNSTHRLSGSEFLKLFDSEEDFELSHKVLLTNTTSISNVSDPNIGCLTFQSSSDGDAVISKECATVIENFWIGNKPKCYYAQTCDFKVTMITNDEKFNRMPASHIVAIVIPVVIVLIMVFFAINYCRRIKKQNIEKQTIKAQQELKNDRLRVESTSVPEELKTHFESKRISNSNPAFIEGDEDKISKVYPTDKEIDDMYDNGKPEYIMQPESSRKIVVDESTYHNDVDNSSPADTSYLQTIDNLS